MEKIDDYEKKWLTHDKRMYINRLWYLVLK